MFSNIVCGDVVGRWVASRTEGRYDPAVATAIGLSTDGVIVAGVIFTDFNTRSMAVHQAITGRINREFLFAVSDYAFNQCGATKVIGQVVSSNKKAEKLVTSMGFLKEATIKDAHPDGDIFVYTLEKQHCRFLKGKYGKKYTSTSRS